MSLRDRILAVDDSQREQLVVPEWNMTIEIRGMSGASRASITQDAADNNGTINFGKMMPEIIVGCVFDPETGEQVFTADDRALVMEKSGAALDKIVTLAMALSGFGEKAVDDAGKGSLSMASADSSLI